MSLCRATRCDDNISLSATTKMANHKILLSIQVVELQYFTDTLN